MNRLEWLLVMLALLLGAIALNALGVAWVHLWPGLIASAVSGYFSYGHISPVKKRRPEIRRAPTVRKSKPLNTNLNARLSKGVGSIPAAQSAPPRHYRKKSSNPHVSPLRNRLDDLTRDRQLSGRLLQHTMSKYPDRDLQWCLEKAIGDLTRDRR